MKTKKRFLIVILMIAAVALVASGGIYAYFSDMESTKDNGIKAGTLDLVVNNQNPWVSAPFEIGADDLVFPGFSESTIITLKNNGTIDGTLTMNVTNLMGFPGTTPEPELALGTADLGELQYNLNIHIVNGAIEIYNGTLSGLNATTLPSLGTLAAGDSMTLDITYSVAITVGNVIMDDSVNFDIGFALIQILV